MEDEGGGESLVARGVEVGTVVSADFVLVFAAAAPGTKGCGAPVAVEVEAGCTCLKAAVDTN